MKIYPTPYSNDFMQHIDREVNNFIFNRNTSYDCYSRIYTIPYGTDIKSLLHIAEEDPNEMKFTDEHTFMNIPILSLVGVGMWDGKKNIVYRPFVQGILNEVYQVTEGYKKVLPKSSMNFDGGYTHVKVYFLKTEKGIEHVVKVHFLSPTQAEFNKDTTDLTIHKYPYFERKTVEIPDGFEKDRYGLYTEDNELVYLGSKVPNVKAWWNKDGFTHEIFDRDFPFFNTIKRVHSDGRFHLEVNNKVIMNPDYIFTAYEETKEALKKGLKPPFRYKLRTGDGKPNEVGVTYPENVVYEIHLSE